MMVSIKTLFLDGESNDILIIDRDVDLRYLLEIHPLKKLSSGCFLLSLVTRNVVNEKKSYETSSHSNESSPPIATDCCVNQCTRNVGNKDGNVGSSSFEEMLKKARITT